VARTADSAASAPTTHAEVVRAVDALVEECRVESLWYLRPDYHPRTDRERQQVLGAIQERCGRDVFRRAGVLKAWLSLHSSDESVSS
jgi:hypothetical protein